MSWDNEITILDNVLANSVTVGSGIYDEGQMPLTANIL